MCFILDKNVCDDWCLFFVLFVVFVLELDVGGVVGGDLLGVGFVYGVGGCVCFCGEGGVDSGVVGVFGGGYGVSIGCGGVDFEEIVVVFVDGVLGFKCIDLWDVFFYVGVDDVEIFGVYDCGGV